jgi:hypothetical protein
LADSGHRRHLSLGSGGGRLCFAAVAGSLINFRFLISYILYLFFHSAQ